MYKKIDINDNVFNSVEFLFDVDKYQVMIKNFTSPTLELVTDSNNYALCRGRLDYPVWVWTKDNLKQEMIEEVIEAMKTFILPEGKTNFTCKEELYNELLKRNLQELDKNSYFKMGFLKCDKTTDLYNEETILDRPKLEEVEQIAKNIYDFENFMDETVRAKGFSMETALIAAKGFIAEETSYVLRNREGKILSMCHFKISGKYGKVGTVFTPVEERRKGYASILTKQVTDIILSENLIPSLFTDYNYPNSNRAYIKAGYTDEGCLINFQCVK